MTYYKTFNEARKFADSIFNKINDLYIYEVRDVNNVGYCKYIVSSFNNVQHIDNLKYEIIKMYRAETS